MKFSLMKSRLIREFCAECLGTFVLMSMALTAIAQRVLGGEAAGSQATVSWATGIGVTLGVYVSGGVSGGHINPAVSVAMGALGRLPWYKVPVYVLGQLIGSFLASAMVFFIYTDALNQYDGGERKVLGDKATGAIWATYPQPYVSTWSGLLDQVFSTCFLLVCILAISDRRNMGPQSGLTPISLGLIVVATNMTLALNCGNAMNPARDLAPRLFTAVAGWGTAPFSFRNYNWWWVPVAGPIIGALLGAAIYQGIVGRHWIHDDAQKSDSASQTEPLLAMSSQVLRYRGETAEKSRQNADADSS
ncbi:aquaporin-7-like [Littorina saxatilis]|uniref:Uncharacterized protein n=1 Tax=Littorina saxatilis TaxID=31220 RepID=A0AAN9C273_9CAEN